MSESQSRYGIMEELNSKKLNEKTQLSKLEADKEDGMNQRDAKISELEKSVSSSESIYKLDYKRWKVQQESGIREKTAAFNSEVEAIKESIKNKDETYESDFQHWKQVQLQNIEILKRQLDDFKKSKDREIKSKNEILAEIDKGIENLKSMSKEQGTK